MKYFIALCCGICVFTFAHAQKIITDIEYSIDNTTNFVPIPISIPADSVQELTVSIDISGLSAGLHTLYMQATDSEGMKSLIQKQTFINIADDAVTPNIVSLEYSIDGTASFVPIPFTLTPDTVQEITVPIDISGLSSGLHTFYIQGTDSNGLKSLIQKQTFINIADDAVTPNIVSLEYSIDGTVSFVPIPFTLTPDTVQEITVPIDISGLSSGLHTFYIQGTDSNGNKSLIQKQTFIKIEIDGTIPDIVQMEYFINGPDPGFGNATPISFTSNIQVEKTFFIDISYLPIGEHYLFWRTKDSNNKWSLLQTDTLHINPCLSSTPIVSIREIVPNPNQSLYEVMGSATVHYYLQIVDEYNESVEGAIIYYSDLNNSASKVGISLPSDEKGILDFNIEVSGADLEDSSDDFIEVGNIGQIVIDSIVLQGYCDNPVILFNEFFPFEIDVQLFEPEKESYGVYGKANVGIESKCLGCTKIKKLGLEFGAKGLHIGKGASSGLKHTLATSIEDHIEYEFQASGGLYANAGLGAISVTSLEDDDPLNFEIEGQLASLEGKIEYAKSFKLRYALDDWSLQRLRILYLMIDYLGNDDPQNPGIYQLLAKVIGQIVGTSPQGTLLEDGNSLAISLGFDTGFSIKAKALNFNIPLAALQFGAEGAIEMGSYNKEWFQNDFASSYYVDLYGGFTSTAQTILSSPYFVEQYGESTTTSARRVGLKGFVNRNQYTDVLGAEFSFSNGGNITIDNVPESYTAYKEYQKNITIGEQVIQQAKQDILSIPNTITKFMVGESNDTDFIDADVSHLAGGTLFFIDDALAYAGTSYNANQLNWDSEQLTYNTARDYVRATEFDFSLEFDKLPGIKNKVNFGAVFNSFSHSEYPLEYGKYIPEANIALPIVEYPNIDDYIQVFESPITQFLLDLQESINNNLSLLQNAFGNFVESSEVTISAVTTEATILVNTLRKWIYDSFNSSRVGENFTFNDFCILEFVILPGEAVFQDGTNLYFDYFYPEGSITGVIAADLDSFVVVSDLFYLTAIDGTDTLVTAPNGDFTITSTVGLDDLAFMGLESSTQLELLYKPYADSLWISLGMSNSTISFNGLGNYALGVRYSNDTIPPTITANSLTLSLAPNGEISVSLVDNLSGVDWASIVVNAGGMAIPYDRVGATNELLINVNQLPTWLVDTANVVIYAKDNAGNLTYEIIDIELDRVTVQFKVFLQGAYTGSDMMSNTLSANNLVPTFQPYHTPPWNYVAPQFTATILPNVVDWILIEVRDVDQNIVEAKAALLLNDGIVQDIDGTIGVKFNRLLDGESYYFIIRHRNHLDIMSSDTLMVNNAVPHDFTKIVNVEQGTAQLDDLGDGNFAMFSGDFDANGVVTIADFNLYSMLTSILNSYVAGDTNQDGNVTIADFNLYQPNSSKIGIAQIRY